MADWPTEAKAKGAVFVSNAEEWTRKSGLLPLYSSATITVAVAISPVRIPDDMIVNALYALNGSSVAGNRRMLLSRRVSEFAVDSASTSEAVALSEIIPQAGVNQWQQFPVSEVLVRRGLYYLSYGASALSGTVQRLYSVLGATSGEPLWLGEMQYSTGGWPFMGDITTSSGPPTVMPIMAVGGIRV